MSAVAIVYILAGQILAGLSHTKQDAQPLRSISAGKGSNLRIALSADGQTLATAAGLRNWLLWDTSTWKNTAEGADCFRALSPNAETVLTVNANGFVLLNNTSTGQTRQTQVTGS